MVSNRLFQVAILATLVCSAANAAADSTFDDDRWHTTLRLYGWLPQVSGTTSFSLSDSDRSRVSMDQAQLLDQLQFAFMGSAEVRKGRWSVVTDLIYLDLHDDGSRGIDFSPRLDAGLSAKVDAKLTGWVWTLAGGYTLWHNNNANVDVVLGARYLQMKSENQLSLTGSGSAGREVKQDLDVSLDLWDVIIGAHGRIAFDDRWFVPYYFDVGTGDSELTSTAYTGVGYAFDWGELTLTYRYLYYDQGQSKTIQDLAFHGPVFGVNLLF